MTTTRDKWEPWTDWRAERVAWLAHAGQVDKAGHAYIDHPARVALAVSTTWPGAPIALSAAWLHDVVEDTPMTEAVLRALGCPDAVVDAVTVLSRNRGETSGYYYRVANNRDALAVKLADIGDNTDPRRLAALEPDEADRLRDKYGEALSLLREFDPLADRLIDELAADAQPWLPAVRPRVAWTIGLTGQEVEYLRTLVEVDEGQHAVSVDVTRLLRELRRGTAATTDPWT